MTHNLELFHYWRSSCSWRVRWALYHKNIAFQSHTINLLKNEQNDTIYKRKNPTGQVPTLVAGGSPITDSMAILEWLEETYPQKPLLPSNTRDRATVREISYMISSGIQPIQNLKVLKFVSPYQDRTNFGKHWIETGLHNIETRLQSVAGSYSFGGSLTFIDLCLIPQVYNAHRFGIKVGQFPTIERIYKSCLKLPPCHKAAPEQQPGATP